MARPGGTEPPVFKDWNKLKEQWNAKGVRVRLRPTGGDVEGKYDAKTRTITLNQERIVERAKELKSTPDKVAKETLRHEFAHYRDELRRPGASQGPDEHGAEFQKINKRVGGSYQPPWAGKPLGSPTK